MAGSCDVSHFGWRRAANGHGRLDHRAGKGSEVTLLQNLRFLHSPGLLYSAFTAYCGFRINSGEYNSRPTGEPRFVEVIYTHLVEVKEE